MRISEFEQKYLDDAGDFAFDGTYKLKDYKKTWWLKEDMS